MDQSLSTVVLGGALAAAAIRPLDLIHRRISTLLLQQRTIVDRGPDAGSLDEREQLAEAMMQAHP